MSYKLHPRSSFVNLTLEVFVSKLVQIVRNRKICFVGRLSVTIKNYLEGNLSYILLKIVRSPKHNINKGKKIKRNSFKISCGHLSDSNSKFY